MKKLFAILTFTMFLFACSEKPKEEAYQPEDHGHEHTPNLGVMAEFKEKDGAAKGFVELKLHDDKGDVELWLTTDKDGRKVFDLGLDAVVKVSLPKLNKEIELKVRNKDKNEN